MRRSRQSGPRACAPARANRSLSAESARTRATPGGTAPCQPLCLWVSALNRRFRSFLGAAADPLLASHVYLLLPEGNALLQPVDRVLAGCKGLLAVRGRDSDDHRRFPDLYPTGPVVDRDLAQLVPRAELVGDLRHDLLGHAAVGLVLEVLHDAVAGIDARRPDERRDRPGFLSGDLGDDRVERQRLLAEEKVPTAHGRDQRDLVAVAQLAVAPRVLLVHGV